MMNLVGCSKENFFKLMRLMNYKLEKTKDNKEEFFIYNPKYSKNKNISKKPNKHNPFEKLSEMRFR